MATTFCAIIFLAGGIAFAGYTVYQNVWKTPIIEEKPAQITEEEKKSVIQENEIQSIAKTFLEKLGYPEEQIKKVELKRSYSDDANSYYSIATKDEYKIPNSNQNIGIVMSINAKTGKFQYFLNNDFNILKNKLQIISKEQAINYSREILEFLEFSTINDYNIKSCENDKNEWAVSFSRSYNQIYNRYDTLKICFGVINEKIVVHSVTGLLDNTFTNNEFIISEQEAIDIAKKKEKEFSDEEIIKITAKKDIEKMNPYIYCLENNIQDQTTIKVEDKTRNVWVIKIEHIKEPENLENITGIEFCKKYDSKKYFIDATTGEIIGGDQARFSLKLE